MVERVPLQNLMVSGRSATQPVAWRAGALLSFGDFRRSVAAWQAAFEAHPGSRFALHFHDSFEFACALFGVWHAGKCAYLPSDVLPATCARLEDSVDGFVGDVPSAYATVAPQAGARESFSALDPDAQALVIFTSGSSGEPSAIKKHLRQIFSEVATLAALWDEQTGTARVTGTVSHQHIYGLLFRVLWPLASARVFAAQQLANPVDIVAALRQAESAALVASPAQLRRLPEDLPWSSAAERLRVVFSSGGPLPDEALAQTRLLLGRAPIEIYGSSETGGIAHRQRHEDVAAAWQPMPGVTVRIVDEMLQVSSAHLADANWLATEDRASGGPDGFVMLGRADRIIKIEERRVSLSAIERAALASKLIAEVRLVALPDSHHPLGAVAVPNAAGWALYEHHGKRTLVQALDAAIATVAEGSVRPRRWRFVASLPNNSQGKATEAALAALFDTRRPPSRLLSRSAEHAALGLTIDERLPYFKGHFEAAPVLPGVTQVEWAIVYGRELFELPSQILRLESLKFYRIVAPPAKLVLDLQVRCSAEATVLAYEMTSDAGRHSSGRVVFGSHP